MVRGCLFFFIIVPCIYAQEFSLFKSDSKDKKPEPVVEVKKAETKPEEPKPKEKLKEPLKGFSLFGSGVPVPAGEAVPQIIEHEGETTLLVTPEMLEKEYDGPELPPPLTPDELAAEVDEPKILKTAVVKLPDAGMEPERPVLVEPETVLPDEPILPTEYEVGPMKLKYRSYRVNWNASMSDGKPLLVFVCGADRHINRINQLVDEITEYGGLNHWHVSVIDYNNTFYNKIIEGKEASIQMIAFSKINGKWKRRVFSDLNQVFKITNTMRDWAEQQNPVIPKEPQ